MEWKNHEDPQVIFSCLLYSADETVGGKGGGGGGRCQLPGPDYVAYVILFLGSVIIFRLYKLTVSDQTQVTPNLGVSLSDLV